MVRPAAGSAVIDLPATASAQRSGRAVVGGLPVTVTTASTSSAGARTGTEIAAPGKVKVEVLDPDATARAGFAAAMRISRADGQSTKATVRVEVDYSAVAHAFGGDYGSRLRLISVPACALSTPQGAACADVRMAPGGRNDTAAQVAGADVAVGTENVSTSEILALAGTGDGSTGTFGKSSISASYTWQAGKSSGAFSWSYPLQLPEVAGGLKPDVAFAYDSALVDGRTNAESAQTSWLGEGWNYTPGYVERSYRACADDTDTAQTYGNSTGDACWRGANARLVLGSHSTDLILDATAGTWRMAKADGSTISKVVGPDNIDNDNEMWVVTTPDGTKYYFGLNLLPGRPAGAPQTESVWTKPVFGNHSSEPCYSASSFAASYCWQAWRWNLDYVVDVHGNSMSYWYAPEWARTGRAGSATSVSNYVRGGYLARIEYGTRFGHEFDGWTAAEGTRPPARISFTVGDRCLAGCWLNGKPVTANWYDTPWDLDCTTTATSCPGNISPSFFLTKWLTRVESEVGGTPVKRWDLKHTFPATGEASVDPAAWLEEITQSGYDNDHFVWESLPAIHFGGARYANRTESDWAGVAKINRYRLTQVLNETGGEISVGYEGTDCLGASTSLPNPDYNAKRCYPAIFKGVWTWWNKYRVTSVKEIDRMTGQPDVVHTYAYSTAWSTIPQLWHHDDDVFGSKLPNRSWSNFRGWPTVTETVGVTGGPVKKTVSVYFRGMYGDRTDAGDGTRTDDGNGNGVKIDGWVDYDWRSGFLRREETYDGAKLLATHWDDPTGVQVAMRTVAGSHPTVFTGWMLKTARAESGVRVNVGTPAEAWRYTLNDTVYADAAGAWDKDAAGNVYGQPRRTIAYGWYDLNTAAATGDEVCTDYTYARKIVTPTGMGIVVTPGATALSGTWIVDKPASTIVSNCGALDTAANRKANTLAADRTYYDGQAELGKLGSGTVGTPAAPRGLATRTEKLASWTAAPAETYALESTTAYDEWGRTISAGNALGKVTRTEYTMTGGLTTTIKTINPLGHESRQDILPRFGQPASSTDANGKVTTATYDAFGRLAGVRYPGRTDASTGRYADVSYSYVLSKEPGRPSFVSTTTIGANITASGCTRLGCSAYLNDLVTSYEVFDGLLRPRQTIKEAPGGGRSITDTAYNGLGLQAKTTEFYDASPFDQLGVPAVVQFNDADVVRQHRFTYDNLGRRLTDELWSRNARKWLTSTVYQGDRTTVTPPSGAMPTQSIVDANGRTVEQRQFRSAPTTGAFDFVRYGYDRLGRLVSVQQPKDDAGTAFVTWTSEYDLRGRKTRSVDPDAGSVDSGYYDDGKLKSVRDARGMTLAYAYDDLGRRTELWSGAAGSGTLRAAWTYDGLAKGQPDKAIRYSGPYQYVTRTAAFDDRYRPTASTVELPDDPALGALAGTSYTTTTTYNVNGSPATVDLPAVGDLPAETLTYAYDALGLTTSVTGLDAYVTAPVYRWDGTVAQLTSGPPGRRVVQTWTFDDAASRLSSSHVESENAAGTYDDRFLTEYGYDDAGNVAAIAGKTAGVRDQVECFTYDHARRLRQAWTAASWACSAGPQRAGADPYWREWSYDPAGNRRTQDDHGPAGITASIYTADASQPHTLEEVRSTDPAGAVTTRAFDYDAAGNMNLRTAGNGAAQALTFDEEGRLAILREGTATTDHLYDADGNRLLVKESGRVTVYLPGGTEVIAGGSPSTVTGTRYYSALDTTVAVRTAPSVTWIASDHHGTGQIQIDAATLTAQRRRTMPFGEPRGAAVAWVGTKGFVGGTRDASGLTHLGAREYDDSLGRFLSTDPVFDPNDPQQINGYGYGSNNPVSMSDPTGRKACIDEDDCGGAGWGSKGPPPQPLLNVKLMGRPMTGAEYGYFQRKYGYQGSQNFTLRDALGYRTPPNLRVTEGPNGYVFFMGDVCKAMGGGPECSPMGSGVSSLDETVAGLPGVGIPQSLANAAQYYQLGQYDAASQSLVGAVGAVPVYGDAAEPFAAGAYQLARVSGAIKPDTPYKPVIGRPNSLFHTDPSGSLTWGPPTPPDIQTTRYVALPTYKVNFPFPMDLVKTFDGRPQFYSDMISLGIITRVN